GDLSRMRGGRIARAARVERRLAGVRVLRRQGPDASIGRSRKPSPRLALSPPRAGGTGVLGCGGRLPEVSDMSARAAAPRANHAAPRAVAPDAGFSIVLVVSTILILIVLGLG